MGRTNDEISPTPHYPLVFTSRQSPGCIALAFTIIALAPNSVQMKSSGSEYVYMHRDFLDLNLISSMSESLSPVKGRLLELTSRADSLKAAMHRTVRRYPCPPMRDSQRANFVVFDDRLTPH
ncbi:hypothetical protein Tco_0260307 [Tanacetum coccineum]